MYHIGKCPKKYNGEQDSDEFHQYRHHDPLESCAAMDYHDYIEYSKVDILEVNEYKSDSSSVESRVEIDDEHFSFTQSYDEYDYTNDNDLDDGDEYHVSTAISKLQIKLNVLINAHKASIKLYDDIVGLFNDYITSPHFDKCARLKRRKQFVQSIEESYNVSQLRPRNANVRLHDGSIVTVPVFDARSMIMDLLSNPSLINQSNIAAGYNIFNGDVDETHEANSKYGEIHTGNDWLPARDHFCRPHSDKDIDMPVALVVFGDKSHTDLHGALAVTPLIFTLTMFNQAARSNPKFWRPLGYIPNLSYGKNKADKTSTTNKLQDEHNCLATILESLRVIHRNGGFRACVWGREVTIKVWVHFFIGDTEGNNKWLGHFPGYKRGVHRPYRDCKCSFDDMSSTNPSCEITTLNDMRLARRILRDNKKEGLMHLKRMSRYDIKNALCDKYMPLSDQTHGPYYMMPPELLHTSGSGLIKYMFESLQNQIGEGKIRDSIDKLHVQIYMSLQRQSERDFPRGSLRNGIIDGTK